MMADNQNSGGTLDAIIEIARTRAEQMNKIKAALAAGNEREALSLTRSLVGLESLPTVTII